jgi:hypothetical protein
VGRNYVEVNRRADPGIPQPRLDLLDQCPNAAAKPRRSSSCRVRPVSQASAQVVNHKALTSAARGWGGGVAIALSDGVDPIHEAYNQNGVAESA